jgi:hypothetical protein
VGLDFGHFLWDSPRVKTLTADSRRRVMLPDAKPGQVFAYELAGKGQFLLTTLKKEDAEPVREIKLIRGDNGFYQWPANARATRAELLAAIRADRAAQK